MAAGAATRSFNNPDQVGLTWIYLDYPKLHNPTAFPTTFANAPRARGSPSAERQPPSPATAGRWWRPGKMRANPVPRSPNTTNEPRMNHDLPGLP